MKPKAPIVEGEIPSPDKQPKGCPFHTRCPHAFALCESAVPEAFWLDADHFARCHLVGAGRRVIGRETH